MQRRSGRVIAGTERVGTELAIALLLSLLAIPSGAQVGAPEVPLVEVKLTVTAKQPGGPELTGAIGLRPFNGVGEARSVEVRNGQVERLSLPANSWWLAAANIKGYWTPPLLIEIGSPGPPLVRALELLALGVVTARLQAPRGERLPKEFEVRLLHAPKVLRSSRPPRGGLTCPVAPNGAWHCEVPAATLDLMLVAPGFVPQYRWAQKVEPWAPKDLGRLVLKKGASLAGWVEVEQGELDAKRARARLFPLLSPGGQAALRSQLTGAALEGSVLPSGFFQFAGIGGGTYSLEIEQPSSAPTRVEPIELAPLEQKLLPEPVLLRPTFALRLRVVPPLDWLGRPWRVAISTLPGPGGDARSTDLHDAALPEGGVLELPDQRPGEYLIRIADALGNRFGGKRWTVSSAADSETEVRLQYQAVSGQVRLGSEPLLASLTFGGKFGGESLEFETDDEGRFSGVLPHAGIWRVDVEASTPPIEARTFVTVKEGDGARGTDITLPDTEVFGQVLLGDHPAAAANVTALTGETSHSTTSGSDGTFRFRALAEGRVVLSASASLPDGRRASAPVVLDLSAGPPVGPVELRLSENRRFHGSVSAEAGPVPGATIDYRPTNSWAWERVSTDLVGRFESTAPAGAASLHVMISALGYGFQVAEVPSTTEPVALVVSRERGELRLSLPSSPRGSERGPLAVLVFQNGLPLPFAALTRWARAQGVMQRPDELQLFPAVAPGHYRACALQYAALLPEEVASIGTSGTTCDEGYLAAGGSLQLDLSH